MNVWIFVLLIVGTAAQTAENDKANMLSVKRDGKRGGKKKANKKDKKKNKGKSYGNNYAPPPNIPFAPEPVYKYPTPPPLKLITTPSPPAAPRQLGVCFKNYQIKFRYDNLFKSNY